MSRVVPFLLLLLIPNLVLANIGYKRSISFEWEPILNANSYELQITKLRSESQKPISFTTKTPEFNGKLIPGRYSMRLRSIDRRGIPGVWAPPREFDVPLEKVKMQYPATGAQITAKEPVEQEINFKWTAVGGAEAYKFELVGTSGKINIAEETKNTNITVKVPVAQTLTWKVLALGAEGLNSEELSQANFSLLGNKLKNPQIEKPESGFVREIKWTRPKFAENYDFLISRYNPTTKKWEKKQGADNYNQDSVAISPNWQGGKYKLLVRAKAPLRESSSVSSQIFNVKSGDRSPAAEYTATIRKAVDRINGWYGMASYFITEIGITSNYRNLFQEHTFKAIGGTGRVGVGWMGEKSPWGFLAIGDYGGFLYNGKVSTYASMEASAIYRALAGERAELRTHLGIFYKQTPQSLPDINNENFLSEAAAGNYLTTVQNLSTLGPHVGFEYWYSFNQKLGMQFNTHFYYNMMKMSTPSGDDIQPSLSMQYGLMGSYRMTKRFTGLTGITYREENSSYKDNQIINGTSSAITNDVTTKINGFYLSFYGEYAF